MKPEGISGLFSPFVKKFRIKIALKYIEPGMEILDIGCGFGEIIKNLPEGSIYTGIEKDEYLFNFCKEKYPEKKFLFGNAEEIIFNLKEKFDIILLLSVIEHLKNPIQFLPLLEEKLKEKGKILIYSPSPKAKEILKFGSKVGILSKIAQEEHQNLLPSKELIKKMEKFSFALIYRKNFFLGLSYFLAFEKK